MALSDAARRWTERELERIESLIADLYAAEVDEVSEEWITYIMRFETESERYQTQINKAMRRGDEAETKRLVKEYKRFVESMTLLNPEYQAVTQNTALKMAQVEAMAVAIVNASLPRIYSENYNILGRELASYGTLSPEALAALAIPFGAGTGEAGTSGTGIVFPRGSIPFEYDFEQVDPTTLELLTQAKLDLLKSAVWNQQQVNAIVLAGIQRGESIPQIAKRFRDAFQIKGKGVATRLARTAVTYAENRGRLDSYKWAEQQGIVLHKVWHSTQDKRTRDSHKNKPEGVGNEEQEIDKPFSNGLMCPGDPSGKPAEVWNCRCAMGAKVIGFRRKDGSILKVGKAPWEK